MDQLIRELRELGLTEKEAGVYLASLELGPAVVQDIANKSHVNRATTYVMIEALTRRGLLSEFVKGKKRFYVAESPERLLSLLREERHTVEQKEVELSKAMPMLMALYNVEGAKPQIRYFEGVEGVKTVRELFEKQRGDFEQIAPLYETEQRKELVEGREEHLSRLAAQNIKCRALFVVDRPDHPLTTIPFEEARLLPKEKFPIQGEMTIRENTVYLYSHKSALLSVIITSREIAETMRALFNLAWDGAKDFSK